MSTITLTKQDVIDAIFAKKTAELAETEECSVRSIIAEDLEAGGNVNETMESQIARYERGQALLKQYKLVESPRSTAGGLLTEEQLAAVVSPVVQVEAGHIAADVAWYAVALAPRKR